MTAPKPPGVRAMTDRLIAAGWQRSRKAPKEPWFWRDPLKLNAYKMRTSEAYAMLVRREAHGIRTGKETTIP